MTRNVIQSKRPNRQSIRLCEYDYASQAVYFVTICTYQRESHLAEVKGGKVHGLIVIERAMQRANPESFVGDDAAALPLQFGSPPQSIPAIIQNFKSVSAKKINILRQTPGAPVWQRNYYEHIVSIGQDEQELNAIRKYIEDNPLKWELDMENPLHFAKRVGRK